MKKILKIFIKIILRRHQVKREEDIEWKDELGPDASVFIQKSNLASA